MSLRGAAVPRKAATWQSPMVFRSVWGIATPVCALARNDMRFNWCNCKLQFITALANRAVLTDNDYHRTACELFAGIARFVHKIVFYFLYKCAIIR